MLRFISTEVKCSIPVQTGLFEIGSSELLNGVEEQHFQSRTMKLLFILKRICPNILAATS
jgi:hypothetical protein